MLLNKLFPDASLEDARLYLEHTLVTALVTHPPVSEVLPPTHERLLAYVQALVPEKRMVYLEDWGSKRKFTVPTDAWDVSLFHPEVGMYSYRRTAVEILKNPLRQNKKGICHHTYLLRNLFEPIVDKACNTVAREVPNSVITGFLVDRGELGLFNCLTQTPRFFPLQDTADKIMKRKIFARALSRDFALSAGISAKFPLSLWRYDIPVAGVTSDYRVCVTSEQFFQEVFDQFGNVTEVFAL